MSEAKGNGVPTRTTRQVSLRRRRKGLWRSPSRHFWSASLTHGPPYFQTPRGTYVHRTRSAEWFLYDEARKGLAVDAWCGVMTPDTSRLHGAPVPGAPLCATCEARAVGAGLPASEEWTCPPLKFSPRADDDPAQRINR